VSSRDEIEQAPFGRLPTHSTTLPASQRRLLPSQSQRRSGYRIGLPYLGVPRMVGARLSMTSLSLAIGAASYSFPFSF